jgi:hypothetical protein
LPTFRETAAIAPKRECDHRDSKHPELSFDAGGLLGHISTEAQSDVLTIFADLVAK